MVWKLAALSPCSSEEKAVTYETYGLRSALCEARDDIKVA